MEKFALLIITAFILDCILGDPQNPLHPIRIIGAGISLGIKGYRRLQVKNPAICFLLGMFLSVVIVFASFISMRLLTRFLYGINFFAGFVAEAVLCYFIIAPKALKDESMKVHRAVVANDLDGARYALSFIVGRDTHKLSFTDIIKATVETVAENLSDGVIAPIIFIFIGGAPLGMAYKAINTLDSMLGYRNDEFEYFGKFAARLDDTANFIPSRISAVLMLASTVFIGMNTRQALRIFIRDRYKHKSPNSAQTEAVCAGALGLSLGGISHYKGVAVHKPTIGDELNTPEPRHIVSANRLMYAAAIMTIVVLSGGYALVQLFSWW